MAIFGYAWVRSVRLTLNVQPTLHLCQIAAELEYKQAHLQIHVPSMNTGDVTGRQLFNRQGAIGPIQAGDSDGVRV